MEKLIAQQTFASPEIRRLMPVPGVNLICAATSIAAVGDPQSIPHQPQTGGVPRPGSHGMQSGEGPGRRAGSPNASASARWPVVEAAWIAVRQSRPVRAFYQRNLAWRGHSEATVATARKLAVLF